MPACTKAIEMTPGRRLLDAQAEHVRCRADGFVAWTLAGGMHGRIRVQHQRRSTIAPRGRVCYGRWSRLSIGLCRRSSPSPLIARPTYPSFPASSPVGPSSGSPSPAGLSPS